MKTNMTLRVIKIGGLWYVQGLNQRNGEWFRVSDHNTQPAAEKAMADFARHATRPDPWTRKANTASLTVHDSEDAYERMQLASMENQPAEGGW